MPEYNTKVDLPDYQGRLLSELETAPNDDANERSVCQAKRGHTIAQFKGKLIDNQMLIEKYVAVASTHL